jgi:hypothetical protein
MTNSVLLSVDVRVPCSFVDACPSDDIQIAIDDQAMPHSLELTMRRDQAFAADAARPASTTGVVSAGGRAAPDE